MSVAFKADRRLCTTADRTRIVEEGNPEAAYLFVAKDGPISAEDATRFGLTHEEGRVVLPGAESEAGAEARAARNRELKGMAADEVKEIAAGLEIEYTNKGEAIDAILSAEFPE